MNKNLATLPLDIQESQLEARKNLEFFQDGYVDGYNFAYWLGQSLWLDGFENIYGYQFIELLNSFATDEEFKTGKVKKVNVSGTNKRTQEIYSEGQTMLFHCTYFLKIHEIVSAIGDEILNIPKNDITLYSWWMKREYIYTYTYLDSFFKSFTKLLNTLPNFKSNIMNLHISMNFSKENLLAFEAISKKETRFQEILDRINKAILNGFYLEAIALQESCISDRLSLALYMKGKKAGTKSLSKLIELCDSFVSCDLLKQINSWRRDRNKSIHNLVRSSPLEEQKELFELDKFTSVTAEKGMALTLNVNNWFETFINAEMNPYYFRIPEDTKILNG
ncbi:hypothetical protein [Alishewanella sp. SMS8]|uniref:hypothetical protein n=1 Tax=Alishewanella sp. SMS8 TaxID=2994676 RepID=UPI0027411A1F|nr:hypothetical protein [Alishewanella sp. SMS8]MDP5459601.1 hypothetical protein [Alishewanella sp. SMS8]